MAYNRKNLYKRIIKIQNIVLDKKRENEDMYYKEIFWEFIHSQYNISYRTFNSYMGINAKRKLKELQENEKKQLKLF